MANGYQRRARALYGKRCFLRALLLIAGITLLPLDSGAQTAFAETVRGAVCKQDIAGSRVCDYHVGRSLWFRIAGVGERDVGISFLRSDQTSDYYARFGPMHGCVIVAAGAKGSPQAVAAPPAFVSPRDGRVFRTWKECSQVSQIIGKAGGDEWQPQ